MILGRKSKNWGQNQSEDFFLVFTQNFTQIFFYPQSLENQNLGKTPQIFFGWCAYAHIAAMSRVGLETQRFETETRPRLRKTCLETSPFAKNLILINSALSEIRYAGNIEYD